MKKKLSFILAVVVVLCMAIIPASAMPATATVQWQGSNTTYASKDIVDDMRLEVSASLYINTTSFSTFESCNLSLKYDNSIIDTAGSAYTEDGYFIMGDKMDFGYNVIVGNVEWAEADGDGLCTTVYIPMKIKDAAAFIENGGIEIGLDVYNNDLSVNIDENRYSYADWVEKISPIEIKPTFSPITIGIKDAETPPPAKETWTVIYDTNGGEEIDVAKVEKGQSITLPTPVKEGSEFEGWFTESTFKNKVNTEFTPSKDLTLYAKWVGEGYIDPNPSPSPSPSPDPEEKEWSITFDTNGGNKLDPVKVVDGKEITLPTPVKEGNDFDGWYSDKDFKNKVSTKYKPDSDATLYAKWKEKAPVVSEWTITYETNGGNTIDASKVKDGESITLPTPTRSGYKFSGWYTDKEFTNRVNTKYTPDKDVTLYAKWTANSGSGSVPQTGFQNTAVILMGVIAALVVCAGAIVFVKYRKNKNEN